MAIEKRGHRWQPGQSGNPSGRAGSSWAIFCGLEPDDWQLTMEILQATRQALPDANDRKPGEVLSFVLDAIRAHSVKAIDPK